MNPQVKNILVGIFVLSGISIFVATIFFLKPSIGDGKQVLYVRFSNINNIREGTRVLFAGRPIGDVASITVIRNARQQPTDELGRVYYYQLTLHIDSKIKVYNTDEISIQTSGLLGEKSICITPKAPPPGITPKLIGQRPIYADSVDALQNALLDFSELSAYMEETFKDLSSWIKTYGDEVAATIRSTGNAMEEIEQTIATVNQTELISSLQQIFNELTATLMQLDDGMTQLHKAGAFENVGSAIENLKKASQGINQVTAGIAQGKGTAGKLLVDNDTYLQINAIMTKANTLMNDLNHYGLLFHLNKQWQRTHLKRISRLNALSSPNEFREYFQQEVDDINASMARISMLINKAQSLPERKAILNSSKFKDDFAELLRRADELSDNLRLYNQQIIQAAGH